MPNPDPDLEPAIRRIGRELADRSAQFVVARIIAANMRRRGFAPPD